jgi:hypothetical protein
LGPRHLRGTRARRRSPFRVRLFGENLIVFGAEDGR